MHSDYIYAGATTFILTFVVPFAIFTYIKTLKSKWKNLAKKLNLKYSDEGHFSTTMMLSGKSKNRRVSINSLFTKPVVDVDKSFKKGVVVYSENGQEFSCSNIKVRLPKLMDFYLKITFEDVGSFLNAVSGSSDFKVKNPEFDKKFFIKAIDKKNNRVLKILTPQLQKKILTLVKGNIFTHFEILVFKKEITIELSKKLDVKLLEGFFEVAESIADVVESFQEDRV